MESFRRFILSVADGLAFLSIIVTTIVSGVIGAAVGAATGAFTGNAGSRGVIGFILGGAGGFVTAALASALLFTLMEIAANTRRTRELLERLDIAPDFDKSLATARAGRSQSSSLPENESRNWKTNNGQVVTRSASDCLMRAKSLGYEIRQEEDNTILVVSPDGQNQALKTNAEVLIFGAALATLT